MARTVTRRSKHTSWDHPERGFDQMYKTQQQYSACGKKTGAYSHEKEALAHARKFTPYTEEYAQVTWRAYECGHCGKWHLTTKGIL